MRRVVLAVLLAVGFTLPGCIDALAFGSAGTSDSDGFILTGFASAKGEVRMNHTSWENLVVAWSPGGEAHGPDGSILSTRWLRHETPEITFHVGFAPTGEPFAGRSHHFDLRTVVHPGPPGAALVGPWLLVPLAGKTLHIGDTLELPVAGGVVDVSVESRTRMVATVRGYTGYNGPAEFEYRVKDTVLPVEFGYTAGYPKYRFHDVVAQDWTWSEGPAPKWAPPSNVAVGAWSDGLPPEGTGHPWRLRDALADARRVSPEVDKWLTDDERLAPTYLFFKEMEVVDSRLDIQWLWDVRFRNATHDFGFKIYRDQPLIPDLLPSVSVFDTWSTPANKRASAYPDGTPGLTLGGLYNFCAKQGGHGDNVAMAYEDNSAAPPAITSPDFPPFGLSEAGCGDVPVWFNHFRVLDGTTGMVLRWA